MNIFTYKHRDGEGYLYKKEDKWYIKKGSIFAKNPMPNFISKHGEHGSSKNLLPIREKIISLYCVDNVLQADYEISSPALAGALISYDAADVKKRWKDESGLSLSEIEPRKTNKKKGRSILTNHNNKIKGNKENGLNNILKERSLAILNNSINDELFVPNVNADKLLKDLKNNPFAFLIGCLVDRQITAEKAWEIPHKIENILGDLKYTTLSALSLEDWLKLFRENNLHRFNDTMAIVVYEGIKLVGNKYNGNPNDIWNNVDSASEVVDRFAEFNGIGQKISTMAVNILMKNFKIPFKDKSGIDISTDSQVMKVMTRIGLIENENQRERAVKVARKMNSDYPGVIDLTLWEIGRNYCHIINPNCKNCIIKEYCKYNGLRDKIV